MKLSHGNFNIAGWAEYFCTDCVKGGSIDDIDHVELIAKKLNDVVFESLNTSLNVIIKHTRQFESNMLDVCIDCHCITLPQLSTKQIVEFKEKINKTTNWCLDTQTVDDFLHCLGKTVEDITGVQVDNRIKHLAHSNENYKDYVKKIEDYNLTMISYVDELANVISKGRIV